MIDDWMDGEHRATEDDLAGHLNGAADHPLLGDLITGDYLNSTEFAPISWHIPGILAEGMTLLVGGPKIGKSWLSLAIALAVADGGTALQSIKVPKARPVLLLALEDGPKRLQSRCRMLLGNEPIPSELRCKLRIEPGMIDATIRAWLETLPPDAEPPLVILDTLGRVMPPALQGENAYQRDYRVSAMLKRICDDHEGMALLALHHDRKATSEDFVDSVSGTNGIAGAADTIVVVARRRNESDALLRITGRDVDENEYAVSVDQGRWRLKGADLRESARKAAEVTASVGLGDLSKRMVAIVGAAGAKGVGAKVVAEAAGCPRSTADTYLSRMTESGRLVRIGRGVYTLSEELEVSEDNEPDPRRPDTSNSSNRGTAGPDATDHGGTGTGSVTPGDAGSDRDRGGSPLCRVCREPLPDSAIKEGFDTHASCDLETTL